MVENWAILGYLKKHVHWQYMVICGRCWAVAVARWPLVRPAWLNWPAVRTRHLAYIYIYIDIYGLHCLDTSSVLKIHKSMCWRSRLPPKRSGIESRVWSHTKSLDFFNQVTITFSPIFLFLCFLNYFRSLKIVNF